MSIGAHNPADRPRVLYITCHGIMSTVFHSQVLAYVRGLREAFDVHLLAMDSLSAARTAAYRDAAERVGAELGPNCTLITHLPFAGRASLWLDARRALRVARRFARDARLIVHGRGQIGGYLGVMVKRSMPVGKVRVVSDIRGATVEETLYSEAGPISRLISIIRARWLREAERAAVSEADALLGVSGPMLDYLSARYPLPAIAKVVPCCVDTQSFKPDARPRESARADLGIGARFAVVYSGGMDAWQLPDRIIQTFVRIRNVFADSVLVILTKETAVARRFAEQSGLPEEMFVIRSAEHADVPRLLAACDLALLVRDSSVVNTVACPTKFAEYLACGLPVAVSPGIGDTQRIAEEYGVGLLAPDELTQEKLSTLRADSSVRERAVRAAREVFDLRRGIESIADTYLTVLAKSQEGAEHGALV